MFVLCRVVYVGVHEVCGCHVWRLLAHGLNIDSAYWTGYLHDVTQDVVYDTSSGAGLGSRGLNLIRISKHWDNCVVSDVARFDTHESEPSQQLIAWLAAVNIGDVILCVSADEASTGLTNAAIDALSAFNIGLSSLAHRYEFFTAGDFRRLLLIYQ